MRNQLVVQFQMLESDAFDDFIRIEDTLDQAFSQSNYAVIDGHDVGQGKFNIFINVKGAWKPAIERAYAFLKLKGWIQRAVIAKLLKSGKCQVIWPANYSAQFDL